MKPPIHDLSPITGRGGNRANRPGNADIAEMERQIAELVDRSTPDLRVAWRQLHHKGPALGLSRDLLIRALAHQLQEQTLGGTRQAQKRRLEAGPRGRELRGREQGVVEGITRYVP